MCLHNLVCFCLYCSGFVMYPSGHARNTTSDLSDILAHKNDLMGQMFAHLVCLQTLSAWHNRNNRSNRNNRNSRKNRNNINMGIITRCSANKTIESLQLS